jgi:hypothetical protein
VQERSSEACVLYTRSVRRASGFVQVGFREANRATRSIAPDSMNRVLFPDVEVASWFAFSISIS